MQWIGRRDQPAPARPRRPLLSTHHEQVVRLGVLRGADRDEGVSNLQDLGHGADGGQPVVRGREGGRGLVGVGVGRHSVHQGLAQLSGVLQGGGQVSVSFRCVLSVWQDLCQKRGRGAAGKSNRKPRL
jgi:hypothetical protein